METQISFLNTKPTPYVACGEPRPEGRGATLAKGGSLPASPPFLVGSERQRGEPNHKTKKVNCFILSIIIHVILFAGIIFASGSRHPYQLSTPISVFIKPGPITMDTAERVNDMKVTPLTPEILPDIIFIRVESMESTETHTRLTGCPVGQVVPQTSAADYSTFAQLKPDAEGRNRKPIYPKLARQLGQEGLVILLVEVDESGKVSDITLKQSSGYKLLDDTALLCVKSWLFNPATKNGKPVASQIEIPIRYKLS